MLCLSSVHIFSAMKGNCRSKFGNWRWTHAWMRWRSAVVILSGAGPTCSRGAGVGESEDAISGVGIISSAAAGVAGAGVGVDGREGDGAAKSQFNRLVVGDETLSRLVVLGPPKA